MRNNILISYPNSIQLKNNPCHNVDEYEIQRRLMLSMKRIVFI